MMLNRGPMMMEEPVEDFQTTLNRCFAATVIISATITKVHPGIATMSLPPQCHYGLELADVEQIRGVLPAGPLKMIIVGTKQPVYGKPIILFGCYQEDHFAFQGYITEDVDQVKQQILNNPVGWNNGTSPFAAQFSGDLKVKPDFVCNATKWPGFKKCGDFALSVAQVIPADAHEYRNPYGDGKFTVTIKNLRQTSQVLPCLFERGGQIELESSLFVIVNDKYHVWPTTSMQGASQVEFGAGEEKHFTIDTLKIKTIDWPNGGSRVYFKFVLGDLIAENFFYFYSACHDKLVGRE